MPALEIRRRIAIPLQQLNAIGRVGLGSRDLQNLLVHIERGQLLCSARDDLGPIARPAGEFKNLAAGEHLPDPGAQRGEIRLALRLGVDALVLSGALGVVLGEVIHDGHSSGRPRAGPGRFHAVRAIRARNAP